MMKRTMMAGLMVAALLSALWMSGAYAQMGQQGGQGGGGRGGGRMDPTQMRQRMLDNIKQQLGATEEEWKGLEPLVSKVSELQRQGRPGGGMGRRGGGQGQAPEQGAQALSPVEKATQDLRTAVDDPASKPDVIRERLKALRDAREKNKQELAKAQEQLREVLTIKQEAQLVLMGMLD